MLLLKEIEETSKIIAKRFYKMYSEQHRLSCNLEKTINYMTVCFDDYFFIADNKTKGILLNEAIMVIRNEWSELSKNKDKENK